MSIFTKPVSQLVFDDLAELLAERAIESVRLEFKREVPNKDETLKKLSSFANTLGGFMVVGAAAGNDGRITALEGVLPQASYKQTLIQWCFDGVSPAIDVEVSDPIAVTNGAPQVCYVVAVRESEVAPHFLNGRKGVFVRTDEFSSRVTSELATTAELQQLWHRRQIVIERREHLIARSRNRFETFSKHKYTELGQRNGRGIGARFELSIGPVFPTTRVCSDAHLLNTVRSLKLPWRSVGFPRSSGGGPITQHESVVVLNPGSSFSILDANVWGLVLYATELQKVEPGGVDGIHVYHFAGQLEIFLRHAASLLKAIGYAGPLRIEMTLRGIQDVPWLYFQYNTPATGSVSVLDDEASFGLDTTTQELTDIPDRVMLNLLRFVFFAVGWHDVAIDDHELEEMVKMGYYYNYSQKPATLRM